MDMGMELVRYGFPVGPAMYEKCLFGSGVYPLGISTVVKAELAADPSTEARLVVEGALMCRMHDQAIGPRVYATGAFPVHTATGPATIVYTVMERYMVDLGSLADTRPSLLLDSTVGWMINRLFRRVAYHARVVLTDLKPTNIVANLDIPRGRISEVVLIDFGPEYSTSLSPDVHPRTAYLSMLLLYSTISTALGFHQCAQLMMPYIARQPPDTIQAAVLWMNDHPTVVRAIRQYTNMSTASELYSRIQVSAGSIEC
jgi:hypothetical protein